MFFTNLQNVCIHFYIFKKYIGMALVSGSLLIYIVIDEFIYLLIYIVV